MKILVLNGSPKAKSDTMRVTNAFLDGIKKTGEHEIEIIDIIKKDIKPCIGCFQCWKNKDGRCVINDFQNEILDKMRAADTILWSFPLYCLGMPGPVKTVLDRTIPLSNMNAKGGEKVEYDRVTDFSKKRYVVICGSGFPLGVANFDAVKMQCLHMFGRVRILCINETPLMYSAEPQAKEPVKKLLARFVEAGEEFGRTTYLCRKTVNELETPMLPNEEYLKIANKTTFYNE